MAKSKPTNGSPCATCIHYDEEYVGICPAFPNGIPDDILNGEKNHDTVIPGQTIDFTYYIHPKFRYPGDDIIKEES